MKAHPDAFEHPNQAEQLNGLGPKLCKRLTAKLEEYCNENGLPMPEEPRKKKNKRPSATIDEPEEPRPEKKSRKVKPYVPQLRSGPYALLLALGSLDEEGNEALSKADLIALAQPHCESSFTAPSDPTKFFTAWNSMKTLESKELVCTKGHPTKRYYLSDEGWEVAKRMKEVQAAREQQDGTKKSKVKSIEDASNPKSKATSISSTALPPVPKPLPVKAPSVPVVDVLDILSDDEPSGHSLARAPQDFIPSYRPPLSLNAMTSDDETITLPPDSFDVRLVLDNREIRTVRDREYTAEELKKLGVNPIVRALPLGDMLWVAQIKPEYAQRLRAQNPGDEESFNTDIVLDHIMERKRLDDLIGSIKDGRFNEQKFRLRKSGIQNVTYLVEDYSMFAERSDKYGEAVESVIASLQVVSDIFVKQTSKLDNTIRYLACVTKALQEIYRTKEVRVVRSKALDGYPHLELMERLRKKSPSATIGTTFSAFASVCHKSESMTLRDVYLKMLLCIRGLTPDKAVEIQKLWPTPQALISAFERQPDAKGKENMIASRLSDAIPRKKVGKALSAKIADVWS
jgi:crossover junction endonuclease MUS81